MDTSVETNRYVIKTNTFEGPFEVLLSLIEDKKLHINEISLMEVTQEYIQYIQKVAQVSLGEATQFAVIAATLMLIKSRSLLPDLELSKDEETAITDLEVRLALYKMIQDTIPSIKESFGTRIMRTLPERSDNETLFSPGRGLSKECIEESIRLVLDNLPKTELLPEVTVATVISIEEMITSLEERVRLQAETSFNAFSRFHSKMSKEERIYAIVSFLAILELVRSGIVDVLQGNAYDDMVIKKQESTL